MNILSIFNNKGGVGKTTYLFHIANELAQRGRKILMVDCDTQCNLSAYALTDAQIERSWGEDGNSIYRAIEPVSRGVGDIRNRAATEVRPNLFLIPGDLQLSDFEDKLGEVWTRAMGGDEYGMRAQSAIYRVILQAAEKCSADLVLVDLGPNLGALNRSVLAGSTHLITPVAPDLFSIRGTENLGSKLVTWRREWDQALTSWRGNGFPLPAGRPQFVGYVVQQHNIRNTATGMTKGWDIFGSRVDGSINANVVERLRPLQQVLERQGNDFNLGQIPNLHSLIPYSLAARKPVFDCTSQDGLRGEHISKAANARDHFTPIADFIDEHLI